MTNIDFIPDAVHAALDTNESATERFYALCAAFDWSTSHHGYTFWKVIALDLAAGRELTLGAREALEAILTDAEQIDMEIV